MAIWAAVGALGGLVTGIFGGSKKKAAAEKAEQKAQYERLLIQQKNIAAQKSKKTMIYVAAGALGLVLILFTFFRK